MASSRTVLTAGAGIGGLTAALALAKRKFQVGLFEQATHLEEIGAGIQLSPNASRVLIALGLRERLERDVVAPQELTIRNARTGRVLARAALGDVAGARYGAPFWVIHRGDLQAALLEAVRASGDITLSLGVRVDDFAVHKNGVTIAGHGGAHAFEERGIALVGADGLWSRVRGRLGHRAEPRFAHYTAWRALVPAQAVAPEMSSPALNLWLGRDAHLVHYPVRAGTLINVVAIVRDDWHETGWNAPGDASELASRFPAGTWQAPARELLAGAERWHKWALFDCAPLAAWGKGPVTLLGDAAHPMLPQLAQGGAMAIEDAAVLADRMARTPNDPEGAMRDYERARLARTTRTQQVARRNSTVFHMGGAEAFLRTLALMALGGRRLLASYDWLYSWTPD